jgi:hypothetical protein
VSIIRCDLCGRAVDTDLEVEGVHDKEADIFSCEQCQDGWKAEVTGESGGVSDVLEDDDVRGLER